jgi:hypothetical protein
MLSATAVQAEWDQRDADERERLVGNDRALDVLCRVNEFLVNGTFEQLRTAPDLLLEIVHAAAIERLSLLTISVIVRNEE